MIKDFGIGNGIGMACLVLKLMLVIIWALTRGWVGCPKLTDEQTNPTQHQVEVYSLLSIRAALDRVDDNNGCCNKT